MNTGGPSSGTAATVNSAGNRVPSPRRASISRRSPRLARGSGFEIRPKARLERRTLVVVGDQFGEPPADRRVDADAEDPLGGRVELDDVPFVIERDQGVERGFQNAPQPRFAFQQ